MSLVVEDTDEAIDDVTRITVEKGGYLIGLETTLRDGFKEAKLVLGVPVEEFENLQQAVRGIALRVLKDNALGVDVTDQYVDSPSRLANLEATQARIRQFLDKATTVTPSPTPIAWRPGETFHAANRSLGGILRVVGDIAIWLVVMVVPVLVAPVVVIIVLAWLSRRRRARTQGAPSQGPAARASTEAGDPGASPPNPS